MIFEPFWAFFPVGQMDSAPSQNDRYIHYISAIRDGPLPITAELIEMAQYVECKLNSWYRIIE